MNFRAIAIVVFLVVTGVSLSVYFREKSVVPKEKDRQEIAAQDGVPIPAKEGPFPKIVVEGSLTHDFGTMEHGQKGEHTFTVRNEGEAPLELVARKEDHSCQCTLGSLGANGLKPGESTTVKLTWEIKNPSSVFQHWAKVRTNDPKNAEIMFRVKGIVGRRLVVSPGTEVPLGLLTEGKSVTRSLTIHSELVDHFDIKKIETSSPLIMVTHKPMSEEEKIRIMSQVAMELMNSEMAESHDHKPGEKHDHDEHTSPPGPPIPVPGGALSEAMKAKAPKAKCGYELTLTIKPEMPIGKFRETVTLITDAESADPITINVEGTRPGPIQLLATPGIGWSPEEALLRLPRFPAKEGKKAKLLLFLNKTDQPFEVSKTTIDPPILKCELVRDEKFKGMGREKFDVLIEVPAGNAPVTFGPTNRSTIELETNHPDLKNLRLELEFSSY